MKDKKNMDAPLMNYDTSFVRYFNSKKELQAPSISTLLELIKDENNRIRIAEYVYQRLYTRFLKIFDFESEKMATYYQNGAKHEGELFKKEYKNGFLMLAASSLLIETVASFLSGKNQTNSGDGKNTFKSVFIYAKGHGNKLGDFDDEKKCNFYSHIRNAILHQGETYNGFKVTRASKSLEITNGKTINAYLFVEELKALLEIYKNDLARETSWTGPIWNACRQKIRHIASNASYN